MNTRPPIRDNRDDALAAEFVLGLLEGDAWRDAARRAEVDGAFAALVQAWEQRLAPLNDEFPEMPAPDLLPQIEARLFPQPEARRSFGWRWLGAAAFSGALAFGVVMLSPTLLTPPQEVLTAELVVADRDLVLMAEATETSFTITATGPAADAGRDYELWVIGADGVPASLGVLRGDRVERQADLQAGQVLALSLEPEGGSPTGQPTGPVLATAALASPITQP